MLALAALDLALMVDSAQINLHVEPIVDLL
jgi:hypothetical protein